IGPGGIVVIMSPGPVIPTHAVVILSGAKDLMRGAARRPALRFFAALRMTMIPGVLMGHQERREIARRCRVGRVGEAKLLKSGAARLWLFLQADEREEAL